MTQSATHSVTQSVVIKREGGSSEGRLCRKGELKHQTSEIYESKTEGLSNNDSPTQVRSNRFWKRIAEAVISKNSLLQEYNHKSICSHESTGTFNKANKTFLLNTILVAFRRLCTPYQCKMEENVGRFPLSVSSPRSRHQRSLLH